MTKTCPCGTTGPDNFYRNVSRPDGLCFYCKTCTAKQRKEEYAKKYPDGRGKHGARIGNKNAQKHGRYAGQHAKRPKPAPVPVMTYLDRLIRMPFTNEKRPTENPQ